MPRASKPKKIVATPVSAKVKKLGASGKQKLSGAAEKKTAVANKASEPIKKVRKARVGNVRELILKSLEGGSKTRPALQQATGASYNGLVMHLSKLKDDGLVIADSSNRTMSLAAASAADTSSSTKQSKRAKPSKPIVSKQLAVAPIEATVLPMTVRHARDVLAEAIDLLKGRLARAEKIDDKLLVLDSLAGQIGGPVAEVLMGIKADLLR